jgi:TolA-binding protein
MRARLARLGVAVGGLAIALLAGSCAYYNTFYTAKKSFKEAERQFEVSGQEHPSPGVLDLYQKSIEKSEKLLVDYPKSKWVDDARYLIAMAYLRREDWEKARGGFEDLIANDPKSKLVPDAKLGIGMSLLGLGDHEGAREILEQTLLDYPKFERRGEVTLKLAENAAQRRNYRTAIQGYTDLLAKDPDEDLRRRVLEARGDAYLEVDAPDSALTDFTALAALQSVPEKRYEAELQRGECMERLGRFDEALELYARLEREMPGPNQLPRTFLAHGRTLNEVGRHQEALAMFQRVVTDFPASSFGAEGQFQIGATQEDHLNDLEAAKEAFGKVKEVAPSSEFAGLAEERKHSIELYGEYRAEMSSEDESEKRAEANLKLAELTLFRMRKVEDALTAYQAVERDFPRSSTAPRAAFAVAWIQENELKDSLAAVDSYRHVHDLYPSTEHGVVAGVRAGVLAADSLPIYLGQVFKIKAAADSAVALAQARMIADSLLAAGVMADSLNPDSLVAGASSPLESDSLLALQRAALGAGDSGQGESGLEHLPPDGGPLPPRPPSGNRQAALNPFFPGPVAPGRPAVPDSSVPTPDSTAGPTATVAPDTTAATAVIPDTMAAPSPGPTAYVPPDTTAAAPDTTGAIPEGATATPDSGRQGTAP